MDNSVESLMINSVGEISLAITRTTNTINTALPFVIFGSNDFKAGYATLLKSALAALRAQAAFTNINLVISTTSTGNVLFTYTNGANQDVITISYVGNLGNYAAYLAAMNNDLFMSSLIIYQINNVGYGAAQLQNVITFGTSESLGMQQQNEIPLQSCVKPQDNPANARIAVIFSETAITPDTGIVDSIIPLANFTVYYHTFMSKRMNLNDYWAEKRAEEAKQNAA